MMPRGILKTVVAALLCLAAIPLFVGCGNKTVTQPPPNNPPPATSGSISGFVALSPGMSGDLGNARVAIYSSYDDWNNDRVMRSQAASGSGAQINFVIGNLPGGTYYLDVWKDVDNDGNFDAGDFYGVHGTIQWPTITPAPIAVVVGQTSPASVLIYSIPN